MKETVNISGEAKFEVFGDVALVLDGTVDPKHVPTHDLKQIAYALGAGSFSRPDFFGETLILNHVAWGTLPKESGEVVTEKKEHQLDTPFLLSMGVKKAPSGLKKVESLSCIEVFSELAENAKLGFAFLADATFGVFEGTYLKRSPIFHEKINAHHTEYWEHETPLEDVQAFLFGIVLTEEGKHLLPSIDKAFYQNPGEKRPSHLLSHTHAALCEAHALPKTFDQMQGLFLNTYISGVRHFLTQSVFKEGVFALFDLTAS